MKNSSEGIVTVALAGNPNVGKSTVFNALTGMKQHTGNWAGKTVENAVGEYSFNGRKYRVADLPGTYSLLSHSEEETAARNYLCFEKPDVTVIVCDAVCLERNLNLALQITEITQKALLCINMMDEAKKAGIQIDTQKLSDYLGIPVTAICARRKKELYELCGEIERTASSDCGNTREMTYTKNTENAVSKLSASCEKYFKGVFPLKWCCLRLLENNEALTDSIFRHAGLKKDEQAEIKKAAKQAAEEFFTHPPADEIVSCIYMEAEAICSLCVKKTRPYSTFTQRKIDKLLTGRLTGIPIMLLMLTIILWITVVGANYPSELLSSLFGKAENILNDFLESTGVRDSIRLMLTEGVFRVLGWVVAVMLPPMAIFFPLFTILEDYGILPRIAFNLDNIFKKAGACGKQALCLCMSLGCNACGITGARIIDSKRERLIAILTSSFIPCNGKFPTLISIVTMFFIGFSAVGGIIKALALAVIITACVLVCLGASKLMSITLLKGESSSFTLELPPYRTPQFGKVLIRAFLDRTLFVLGRAAAVAAPAGLIIWLAANITMGEQTVLSHLTAFLNPAGELMGLDGAILLAFILGFPANEIVVPVIIMCYTANSSLMEISGFDALKELLVMNGWDIKTAVCMIIFVMFHFPCSTSCLTVYKETKSIKWTAVAFLLPTLAGIILCIATNLVFGIFTA